jgi:cytochrome c oxidase assembly protein Cox11
MRLSSNRILAMAACLFMATALALAATPAPTRTTKVKRHQATGEILSASPTILVLLHARGRGRQRMTFRLTPETKETVVVAIGRRVTVFYTEENGRMSAVRIRAPKTGKR